MYSSFHPIELWLAPCLHDDFPFCRRIPPLCVGKSLRFTIKCNLSKHFVDSYLLLQVLRKQRLRSVSFTCYFKRSARIFLYIRYILSLSFYLFVSVARKTHNSCVYFVPIYHVPKKLKFSHNLHLYPGFGKIYTQNFCVCLLQSPSDRIR